MGTESDHVFGAETEPERYQLVQELASGGMATVYLARADVPGQAPRFVAIKRIHRHLAREQSFLEMFFDEARIATQISHPNVCRVFDFGRAGGVFYLAMEYVLGETLMELIHVVARDRTLRESLRWQLYVATIVADACDGLHAVHELCDEQGRPMQVVHRDISPNNVFVTYEGVVKVVDFGIAYAQDKVHHTQTGTLKGKVGYMAPELIDSDGRDVDRQADVWGLGVCLWELLVGGLLFRGRNDAATLFNVVQLPIPSLQSVSTVSPELDAVVGRALDRTRSGRYPTAQAFGRELRSWIASTGVRLKPSEIADFMQVRFAPQYARKLDVLDEAHTASGAVALAGLADDQITRLLPIRPAPQPRLESAELIRPTAPTETAIATPGSTPATLARPVPPISISPDMVPAAPGAGVAPRRRRWVAFSIAFVGALLAVGGTGLALWDRQQDDAVLTVTVETQGPGPGAAPAIAPPIAPAVALAPVPGEAADPSLGKPPAVEPPVASPPVDETADPDSEPVAAPEAKDEKPARSSKRKRADRKEKRRTRKGADRSPPEPEPEVSSPEIVEEPEPPVEEPDPPVTRPEPTRPPVVSRPPKQTGPLDATVKVSSLTVQGSLVNSMVSRGIDRVSSSLRTCYRDAAAAAGKNAGGAVQVTLSINESGQVERASAHGGPLPGLDACVKRAAMKIRTVTPPDVGGATARFQLTFTPRGK